MTIKVAFFNEVETRPSAGGVTQFSENLRNGLVDLDDVHLVAVRSSKPGRLFPFTSRFVQETIASFNHKLSDNCDVFYFPNYFIPFNLRKIKPFPICTVHDLQYKYFPHLFSNRKRMWLDFCHKRLVDTRVGVAFISKATQADFVKFFGEPFRHAVIYNGITIPPAGSGGGIKEPFVLASYHFYPHKNFGGVIELFSQLREIGFRGRLVMTGHGREEVIHGLAQFPALRQSVEHLGYVSRTQLSLLYRQCSAFISLSKFEGFNMSAAEAAAAGAPLVLSDIPVHRELFSDVALFVNLQSPDYKGAASWVLAGRRNGLEWPLAAQISTDRAARAYADFFYRCVS